MTWRHYEVRSRGNIDVTDSGLLYIQASYSLGIVSTGKSRVFAGYYVTLVLASGTEFTGEDEHSLRSALLRLGSNLSAVNLAITCSGLDPRWRESGLSENTGWGYFVFWPEAVHMMSPVPTTAQPPEDDLDRLISEAVAGLRIGLGRCP